VTAEITIAANAHWGKKWYEMVSKQGWL
jgi:hypothetical protein